MKVLIFTGSTIEVESNMNKWFEENDVEVKDIKQNITDMMGIRISLFYEDIKLVKERDPESDGYEEGYVQGVYQKGWDKGYEKGYDNIEKKSRYVERMNDIIFNEDCQEERHIIGDDILCECLLEHGEKELVERYNSFSKWHS